MAEIVLTTQITSLAIWAFLLFSHHGFWKTWNSYPHKYKYKNSYKLPKIVAIMPARNEKHNIKKAVLSILRQKYDANLCLIAVDDNSTDDTFNILTKMKNSPSPHEFYILKAKPVPPQWKGKIWAIQQALDNFPHKIKNADFIMLTDADIIHPNYALAFLAKTAQQKNYQMISVMALLKAHKYSQKILLAAFVFFFAKLFPFAKVKNPNSKIAAAAGGILLIEKNIFLKTKCPSAAKNALIDDCFIARLIKNHNGNINIYLSRQFKTNKSYSHKDIFQMISRSAFNQLNYSPLLALATIIAMTILYIAPFLALFYQITYLLWKQIIISVIIIAMMCSAFYPWLRLYRMNLSAAFTLPLVAVFYNLAIIDSIRQYYLKGGVMWKNRLVKQ